MPRLRLRLLGPPRLELDGRPVETDRRKALALFAYLAVTRQPHSREALAALFWPDYDTSRAHAYLRRTVWEIRQAIGEGWVEAERETVTLTAGADVPGAAQHDLWLDVAEFQRLLGECRENKLACAACLPRLAQAVDLYGDHFLAGFSLRDAPGFDDWVFFQAEALRRDLASALETLVRCHLQRGDALAAVPFGRRRVELDPLTEAAHRDLMRAYELSGQHTAALRQYHECARILRDELGAAPQPETMALYEQIKSGELALSGGEKTQQPGAKQALALPSGTVTFLFTDIQGSTPLWERDPAAMQASLAQHDSLLQAAVAAHGGQVFKIVGDGLQAAFSTAAQAIQAAVAAQRGLAAATWGATGPLRVRMGLHAGPAEARGADYDYAASQALNRVERVKSAGHGAQILLSRAVAELVRGHLPPDVRLKDLGEHRLKGLGQPEHIFQVIAPDLPQDFPPLASQDSARHNLPASLSLFIGRENEVAQVRHKLRRARLVTLTGPGGVGKTRLALQVASQVLGDYPDGVWLAELADVTDPALVSQVVAGVLAASVEPGRPALAALADGLPGKRLLLVLDNCEHLIENCARLAETVLHAGPDLKILATSREALGIAGEMVWPVPSLSLPEPPPMLAKGPGLMSAILTSEAVQLFVDRATSALPAFTLSEDNALAVVRVCRQLDGIPLAIELAAARVRGMGVTQIAARLDNRFRLLTGGSRTAPPRQQTLRAALDWSYDLLSESERALLRRLSVFTTGWTLEAAEAVCADIAGTRSPEATGQVNAGDVLDLLAQLVSKSLVVVQEASGQARYRFLDTIRQYAREKLQESGEETVLHSRFRWWRWQSRLRQQVITR